MKTLLIQGDALRIPLADQSVHVCVTSPPYYALRSYSGTAAWLDGDPACDHSPGGESRVSGSTLTGGKATAGHKQEPYRDVCRKCGARRVDRQLGLEPLHDCLAWARGAPPCGECYVCHMRAVFAEVWRVLRDDGSLWLNLGDSYSNASANGGQSYGKNTTSADGGYQTVRNLRKDPIGLKPKDLVGAPWRVALALQADGWYLRSDIIWAKLAPLPESVTDRPSKAHEYIFLLTKRPSYYYDADAISEPVAHATIARTTPGQRAALPRFGGSKYGDSPDDHHRTMSGNEYAGGDGRRNSRTIWRLGREGFTGKHYAAFPTEIPRRAIRAGSSEYGVCPICGAPWERIVDHAIIPTTKSARNFIVDDRDLSADRNDQGSNRQRDGHKNGYASSNTTLGWRPTCACHLSGTGLAPDDLEIIASPTGGRGGDDPTQIVGRAGFDRPRGADEGRRVMTRYEQRQYAAQLRASPHRQTMESEASRPAFEHYVRTDRTGARPIPLNLLKTWIERGWLERVIVPDAAPAAPVPAVVFDPFNGSGTSGLVAQQLGRRYVGMDLSPDYLNMARERIGIEALEQWRGGGQTAGQTSDLSDLPLFGGDS